MKVHLPNHKASGKRNSYWMLVGAVSDDPHARGFNGFVGTRLDPGEHELLPGSVMLHVLPTGTARANEREAEVWAVGSAGQLNLVGDNFSWASDSQYGLLRRCVEGQLYVEDHIKSLCDKLKIVTTGYVGQVVTPETRAALAAQLCGLVAETIPPAYDIVVDQPPAERDKLRVTFTLSAKAAEPKGLVKCAVPCYDEQGAEGIYYLYVRVPDGYENVAEGSQSSAPHHHRAARIAAARYGGVEVTAGCPVYDGMTEIGHALHALYCYWATADIVNLKGERES